MNLPELVLEVLSLVATVDFPTYATLSPSTAMGNDQGAQH